MGSDPDVDVLMTAMGLVLIVFAHWHRGAVHQGRNRHRVHRAVHVSTRRLATADGNRLDYHRALRRAGDSRFPLYGSLAGFYGMRLFLTILMWYHGGSINYIWWSLLAGYVVRSTVKVWRFQTGQWEHIQV